MAQKRIINFFNGQNRLLLTIAQPLRRRPQPSREKNGFVNMPLPKPTHHPPCSVEKVELFVQRRERGESLWHPDDFVPRDPIMIERYVFNGRKASAYKVAELLPSSPRNRE